MKTRHTSLSLALSLSFSFVFFFGLSIPHSARANIFYFELGGGVAQGKNVQALFADSQSSTWNATHYALPLTLGYQLQHSQRGVLFSLAAQSRYFAGTHPGERHTLITTTPLLRVEFWMFTLGAGYSPWTWQNVSFKKFQASTLTLESQILFPITPEIDFGLQATQLRIRNQISHQEMRTLDFGALFRINFGVDDSMFKQRKKFKGWRYPFGNPMH